MKIALFVVAFIISNITYAQSIKWDTLKIGKRYKTNQLIKLQLDDQFFELPKETSFELIEVSDLNMIKVHLHKFQINNCPGRRIETDLQLVNISQSRNRKTSVGVNLTKRCIVEVFIDMNEYSTYSFLEEGK